MPPNTIENVFQRLTKSTFITERDHWMLLTSPHVFRPRRPGEPTSVDILRVALT